GDAKVKSVLDDAHRLARWVVNYDSVIDRRQLQHFGVNVIRYRPSLEEGQNLVVSSRQPDVVVRDHLRRKLAELGNFLPEGKAKELTDRIIRSASEISGELILRTAGKGSLINELLGVVLSREVLRHALPSAARDNAIWIYLDDYAN